MASIIQTAEQTSTPYALLVVFTVDEHSDEHLRDQ